MKLECWIHLLILVGSPQLQEITSYRTVLFQIAKCNRYFKKKDTQFSIEYERAN